MKGEKMREFKSLKIKCRKGLKFSEVYRWLKERVRINSNRFNIGYYVPYDTSTPRPQEYYAFGFDKFECVDRIPMNVPQENQILRYRISNLNDCWQFPNVDNQRILTDTELECLASLADSPRRFRRANFQLTFDEIEWDGNPVCKGTYAYSKARADSFAYRSYMSNSLTLLDEVDGFFGYLTFETKFQDFDIIAQTIDFIGDVKDEDIRYAPEDETERREWDTLQNARQDRLNAAVTHINKMPSPVIDDRKATYSNDETINIRKYIKKYLLNDGWISRKARADEWPIVVTKDRGDTSIVLFVSALHKGHQIQPMICHRSKKFYVCDHLIKLNVYSLSPDNADRYFQNLAEIRDYLYENL